MRKCQRIYGCGISGSFGTYHNCRHIADVEVNEVKMSVD